MAIIPGDPFGSDKAKSGATPQEVNEFHKASDKDSSKSALHHTLGFRPNQAAAGNHTHNNKDSVKIGANENLILTGAKGGNVALTNLIALLKNYIQFVDNTT